MSGPEVFEPIADRTKRATLPVVQLEVGELVGSAGSHDPTQAGDCDVRFIEQKCSPKTVYS